jgi:diaminohydroxyphosphoribosylaminopyrimidine deaminase/5-amino-6-(5-phosphoribosylamino)uracil reductase
MRELFMMKALDLAEKGRGNVSPNPMVGALIVKGDKIIGEGYHEKCGCAHAEVNAFKNAIEDVEGATMYVTLEPCSHYGKTPPCADKIIEKKIAKVVIGTLDPNPLVAGRGVDKLKKAGIEVEVGVLEEECKTKNEIFMKYIREKKPFVIMKAAMSLDGKIATKKGESKWITGDKAREQVHKLRNEVTGIMVGVNTVIMDDPELTCRIEDGKNPIRIIVDSSLRIPKQSKIVNTSNKIRTIIATTDKAKEKDKTELINKCVEIIEVNSKEGKVDLKELAIKLGNLGIDSILLEGGGELNYSALEAGIVDKIQMYIAPKIVGGTLAKGPVSGSGIELLSDAFVLKSLSTRSVGEDILIEGYFVN